MSHISESLRKEAGEAFNAYEKVVVEHLMDRPGWHLDAQPLQDALDSDDETVVRTFIDDMRKSRAKVLDGISV